MLEKEEEQVNVLTLHLLQQDDKTLPEAADKTIVLPGEWDDCTDEDAENVNSSMSEGTCGDRLSPDSIEQPQSGSRNDKMNDINGVDDELALLLYRKGLVFDLKMDSS